MRRRDRTLQLYHITDQATGRTGHDTLCPVHAEILRAIPCLKLEGCDRRPLVPSLQQRKVLPLTSI